MCRRAPGDEAVRRFIELDRSGPVPASSRTVIDAGIVATSGAPAFASLLAPLATGMNAPLGASNTSHGSKLSDRLPPVGTEGTEHRPPPAELRFTACAIGARTTSVSGVLHRRS
jgi:hypothetical protein